MIYNDPLVSDWDFVGDRYAEEARNVFVHLSLAEA